jgi:uncharacterized protein (UPF0335 family)
MAKKDKDPVIPGTKEAENATPTLVATIERIESLKEEQAELADQIKQEMSAIKSMGFDTKIVRKVLARRARKAEDVEEEDMLIETYESAIERTVEARAAADAASTAKHKAGGF